MEEDWRSIGGRKEVTPTHQEGQEAVVLSVEMNEMI